MKCPFCGNEETKVLDKRETEELIVTRRRRECLKCEKRFTTYERIEQADITVVKKDGRRQRYERLKVLNGILKSIEKTHVTRDVAEKITDEVEAEIRSLETNEVESRKIGQMIMKRLKKIDKIAYIRFASVYREFKDIDDFEKELKRLS